MHQNGVFMSNLHSMKTTTFCFVLHNNETRFQRGKKKSNFVSQAIPEKFVRKFGEELYGTVVLKVPGTKEWNVELKEEGGQVWFQKGWAAFVECNYICAWYFLVFKYDGNSLFNVVICDKTGFEIESPCDFFDLEESSSEIGSQSKRNSSPFKIPSGPVRSKMKKKNDTGKRRKSFAGNEENGNAWEGFEAQFVDDKNSKDSLSSLDCRGNDGLTFTPSKFTTTWIEDEDMYLTKKIESEQGFDPCVCLPSGDDMLQIKNMESRPESFLACVSRGGQSNGKGTSKNKSVGLNLHCSKQETRTSGSSIHRLKQRVELGNSKSLIILCSSAYWVNQSCLFVKGDCFNVTNSCLYPAESLPNRPVLVCDKERVILAATEFTSENPFCSITMRSSYVGRTSNLNIPHWFASKYLKRGVPSVTLCVSDERRWQVQCAFRKNHVKLVKGWRTFVLDNHLEEDDVCIFELVDKKHKELKVSIFRVSRDLKHHKGIPAESNTPNCKHSHPVRNKQNEGDENTGKKTKLSGATHCTRRQETGPTVFSSLPEKQQDESVPKPMRPLSVQNRERASKAAREFTSEYPFCSVIMRASYVRNWLILRLPTRFAKKHLKEGSQHLTLKVSDGRTWPVMCTTVNQEYRIVKGWKEFVSDNHLEEDDICIFELVDKRHKILKVAIFRVSQDLKKKTRISAQPSLLNSKEMNGFELIGNEEGHFMVDINDAEVDLLDFDCQSFRSSRLVMDGVKENEDAGKERLFDAMGKNSFGQIGNGETRFLIDKNNEVNLPSFGCLCTSEPIISTSLKFPSDWIDDELWNITNIFDKGQGGTLGFYYPDNYESTMSLDNATSIWPISGVQSKETNIKMSETAEDDSRRTKHESRRKESLIPVEVQTDVSSVARRPVPSQKSERSSIAA
ncbi:hypothetical protein IFM89_011889 [Coptis chinensis]|uniref:Uncharacterized protein n=1 Tax=Coptis chinensis TaxID=261450 RepID=A0A835I031_9MAGN|nr:hypothetical protein IFM89_011889 [Coptis chinensis]